MTTAPASFRTLFSNSSGRDLKLVDYYTPSNHSYLTRKDLDTGSMSAVYFPFKKWELLASAGKEGIIALLDAKAIGGGDHKTPLYRSPLWVNEEADFAGKGFWGSFATWQDESGERWLYAACAGRRFCKSARVRSHQRARAQRKHHGVQSGRERRQARARTGVDFPRYESARSADHRQRRGLRGFDRRIRAPMEAGRRTCSTPRNGRLMHTGNAVLYAFDSSHWERTVLQRQQHARLDALQRHRALRRAEFSSPPTIRPCTLSA